MIPEGKEYRTGRPRFRPRMQPLRLGGGAFGLLVLLAASPAPGELVVFDDGRVVKAATYRVVGEELEIGLRGGGSYRVDLSRIERIVEDEVEVSDVLVEDVRARTAAAAYDLSYRDHRKPLFGSRYDALIEAEARRTNVDAALVSAVIRAESNYQPRAVSRKGARGLMQLMPATARRLAVRRPFEPAANVRGGARYLRELADRFDNRPELVLAAYNAGEAAVEAYGGVPPYRETVSYVERILSWWSPEPAAASDAASSSVSAGR